ncbi:MAG TPA: DNA cytosine methyltransferase [Syntrophorhabdus sp.]|nr:DNA cytosine methyltransferase [Syntrophorhabdus sp.]
MRTHKNNLHSIPYNTLRFGLIRKEPEDYIPIVDLFAGPGGLGEGFSAFKSKDGHYPFKIRLSIEKDPCAHQTLLLRSFFRQFHRGYVPGEYYNFLRMNGVKSLDELLEQFPREGQAARNEARLAELGGNEFSADEIDSWIKKAIGHADRWVLIGGPPCQAYSTVGRSRNKAIKGYNPEKDERHFLYLEYLRIIANHWPSLFIMENVRGILSSKINENLIFPKILDDLRLPSKVFNGTENCRKHEYRIYSLVKKTATKDLLGCDIFNSADYTIKCEDYGIPQARHRVIIVGIRDDFDDMEPSVLMPAGKHIRAEEVLEDLPVLRSCISQKQDSNEAWYNIINSIHNDAWVRQLAMEKATRDIADEILKKAKELELPEHGKGKEFIRYKAGCLYRRKWFHDGRLRGVCNSTTREHMPSDLKRYFFASCFASLRGRSPRLSEFPEELQPDHKNAFKATGSDYFADRFRVQLKNKPSTTIMSHISKDGHYYIHYDPIQCRSLTVREAARLQTFPDNYYFMGSKTQQYIQVGNAVPPLLALKIAEIVYDYLAKTS